MSAKDRINGHPSYVIGWEDYVTDFKKTAKQVNEIHKNINELTELKNISASMKSIDKKIFWLVMLFASVYAAQAVTTVLRDSNYNLKIPGFLEITQEKKE